jgi:hypothetical protein
MLAMHGKEKYGNFLNDLEQATKQAASAMAVVIIAEQ